MKSSATRLLVSVLMASGLGVLATPSAMAGEQSADRAFCMSGERIYSVGAPTQSNSVTHAARDENYTGSAATKTKKTQKQTVLAARVFGSADIEAGGEAKLFKLFSASTKTRFHIEVAVRGKHTSSSYESVTYRMKSGDSYIFYAGESTFTAHWKALRCEHGREFKEFASGPVRSFAIHTEGGVGCHQKVPASSMAAVAKSRYCAA